MSQSAGPWAPVLRGLSSPGSPSREILIFRPLAYLSFSWTKLIMDANMHKCTLFGYKLLKVRTKQEGGYLSDYSNF